MALPSFPLWDKHKPALTHSFFILALLVICAVLLQDYAIGQDWMPMRGDDGLPVGGSDFVYHASNAYLLKTDLGEGHLPLWSPYTLGGMPLFAKPQIPVFQFTWLFLLAAPTAWLGLKWSFLFHLFLAGVGMYLFMLFFLRKEPLSCFIAALLYMLNGNLLNELASGHFNVINAYAWLPFILLCLLLALRTPHWLPLSLGAGFFMALAILGGSIQEGIFIVLLAAFVLALHLIGANIVQRLLRAVLVGGVSMLAFAGLASMKLLPMLELLRVSAFRPGGFTFAEFAGEGTLNFHTIFPSFLLFFGIIGIILLPFAFSGLKKKTTLLVGALLLFALIILTKNPLIHLLWTYVPFLSKMRGVYKVMFLFVFPAAVLLGIGASRLLDLAKERLHPRTQALQYGIGALLCLLIIITLGFFGPQQTRFESLSFQLGKNQILQFMGTEMKANEGNADQQLFRFKMQETNGIDWGTDFYSVPLGLQDIYGYDNVWNSRYMPRFLSVANNDPAKLFGMLNMKYLTSMSPLNTSGFSLAGKFGECGAYPDGLDICQPRKSDGPYLYLNERFLPRAYAVDHAVLILGPEENAAQASYFLMLQPGYDPSTTALLQAPSLDGYPSLLGDIDIIILLASPSQQDAALLKAYADSGGTLFPNIFAGESQLSQERLAASLPQGNASGARAVPMRYLSNAEAAVSLNATGAFLVLSEQFSQYPGWTAMNGRERLPLLTASTVLTAVPITGRAGEIAFAYAPSSVRTGLLIGMLTLLAMIAALVAWHVFHRKKDSRLHDTAAHHP